MLSPNLGPTKSKFDRSSLVLLKETRRNRLYFQNPFIFWASPIAQAQTCLQIICDRQDSCAVLAKGSTGMKLDETLKLAQPLAFRTTSPGSPARGMSRAHGESRLRGTRSSCCSARISFLCFLACRSSTQFAAMLLDRQFLIGLRTKRRNGQAFTTKTESHPSFLKRTLSILQWISYDQTPIST